MYFDHGVYTNQRILPNQAFSSWYVIWQIYRWLVTCIFPQKKSTGNLRVTKNPSTWIFRNFWGVNNANMGFFRNSSFSKTELKNILNPISFSWDAMTFNPPDAIVKHQSEPKSRNFQPTRFGKQHQNRSVLQLMEFSEAVRSTFRTAIPWGAGSRLWKMALNLNQPTFFPTNPWLIYGICPRKLQHTPGAHPRQSPYPTMKGFPLQPVGKGLGVCSKGVLKQPWNICLHEWFSFMVNARRYKNIRFFRWML